MAKGFEMVFTLSYLVNYMSTIIYACKVSVENINTYQK